MQKVVCQMCGLMNLDKFVTYPHCAGCGTRLAETAPPSNFERWKRPVGAPLWATLLGLCCAGLGYWGITITRETGRAEERQLLAYVQLPRPVYVGRDASLELTLDVSETEGRSIRSFENVRLRLPRSMFKNLAFVSAKPTPELQSEGKGQYIVFETVNRDEPIVLTVRALRSGKIPIALDLYARDFTPFTYHSFLQVTRAGAVKVPNSR